jgi:hypothetical protein
MLIVEDPTVTVTGLILDGDRITPAAVFRQQVYSL